MDLDVKKPAGAMGKANNLAENTEKSTGSSTDGSVGIDIAKPDTMPDQAVDKVAESPASEAGKGSQDVEKTEAADNPESSTTDDQPTQEAAATPEPAATEETAGDSKIDATKPVPPNNTINLAEHGTPLAQQVAQETEKQKAARAQELQELAAKGLDPNVPNTEGIKGQAGFGAEINTDETGANNMATPGSATEQTNPNNPSQEPPKKPGFFARLFGKK